MNNYYQILNISRTASCDEIKKLMRQFWKENHPDKYPKKEDLFKERGSMYETLSDYAKRAAYDNELNAYQEEIERQRKEAEEQKRMQENLLRMQKQRLIMQRETDKRRIENNRQVKNAFIGLGVVAGAFVIAGILEEIFSKK